MDKSAKTWHLFARILEQFNLTDCNYCYCDICEKLFGPQYDFQCFSLPDPNE